MVKAGNRMTRTFKNTVCRFCKLADKRALRQGRPCCTFKGKPGIRNGHCAEMKPIKGREGGDE